MSFLVGCVLKYSNITYNTYAAFIADNYKAAFVFLMRVYYHGLLSHILSV